MFHRLLKFVRRTPKPDRQERQDYTFTGVLSADEQYIRRVFEQCDDVKFRKLRSAALGGRDVLLVYVEGLINQDILNRDIIAPLLEPGSNKNLGDTLSVGNAIDVAEWGAAESGVLLGQVLVLTDGRTRGLMIEAKDWPTRAVEEPSQERTIRGPREGFTEVGTVNVALVRRRLPTAALKVERMAIGRRSATQVNLVWVNDIADEDVVQEIRERLQAIDIDGILEPGALQELLTERTLSPFPLLLSTERPDKIAGGLLQGKVAIMADGSPFGLLAPISFADYYQTPEDYYMHPFVATFGRLLRFASLFLATTATAAYTAAIAYHYEMIPRDIVVFIAETREQVPFSPFTEAFLIEIAVELVREASIRLPGPIGPTIGIVGALVLGQAAVEAQLVSPVLLIVVAVGLMANFTLPNYEAALAIRLLRFPILFAAGFL